MRRLLRFLTVIGCVSLSLHARAEQAETTDVRLRLTFPNHATSRKLPASVVWLKPAQTTPASPWLPTQHYTLLQKNRQFSPHLLVVPVGSIVEFPNRDPFFHNVFSLFDGKRFDLGLYEAGSTKSVTFSREGVSYIFCNIHPEMSAVILTLSTSLHSVADASGAFRVAGVPAGDYEMHIWIEGVAQPVLDRMVRHVHVAADSSDLGAIEAPGVLLKASPHTNMYGQPYDRDVKPTY
jgi:plastocyanin